MWNVSPSEAVRIQKDLAAKVCLRPLRKRLRWIAGADVSFNKYSSTVYAGIIVLDAKSLQPMDGAGAVVNVDFPYIPGLLSFREIPPLLQAWKRLKRKPDVLVADGQGIAHPRRLGIASHLGILLDLPTIGCAKSLLVGEYDEPGDSKGESSPLLHRGEQVGMVLRTKDRVKPVFVSPGHLTDFASAMEILLSVGGKYRIPEPTRQAHLYVNELRLGEKRRKSA